MEAEQDSHEHSRTSRIMGDPGNPARGGIGGVRKIAH